MDARHQPGPCGDAVAGRGWSESGALEREQGAGSRERGAGLRGSWEQGAESRCRLLCSPLPAPCSLSKQTEQCGYRFVDERLGPPDHIGRKVARLRSQLEKDLGFGRRAERNSEVSLKLRGRAERIPLNDVGFHGYRGAA